MGHHRCPEQYSCPLIDDILERLLAVGQVTTLVDVGDDGEVHTHLIEMNDTLEEIRKVNHGLREWGCNEARQRDALESEVSCLKELAANQRAELDEWESYQ